MSAEEFAAEWSRLHGGIKPSLLVRAWLRFVEPMARPLARARVSPNALTAAGLVLALATVGAAAGGRGWAIVVAMLVVLSAMFDGLDGAVASLTGRATAWGQVLDSLADRIADAAFLVSLWLLGASAWLCVAAAISLVLLEYTRARAVVDIPIVTVGERPTRVIVTVAFCLAGAVFGSLWFALGAFVVGAVSLIGLVQLLAHIRFAE